jgi:hypothetical protein
MSAPHVKDILPDLMPFVRYLAHDCRSKTITGWRAFITPVREFYTPEVMARIEPVVPGWSRMASFDNQQTLIHVTSVMVALMMLPEYQHASSDQQTLMEWMVLFHDVMKEARPDKHDYTHAFRSAAVAGKALADIGFPPRPAYASEADDWYHLTFEAVIERPDLGETIQDNRKLPAIIAGLDTLYGTDAPAVNVIKAILLHLSLDIDPNYPILAPLSEADIRRTLSPACYPLMKAMMLVDGDGWNLFDTAQQQAQRQLTLKGFEYIATLIGIQASR